MAKHTAAAAQSSAVPARPSIPARPRTVDARTRHELIAQAAYFRAQHRGFESGHELEDWCAAEAEIDAVLGAGGEFNAQDAAQGRESA